MTLHQVLAGIAVWFVVSFVIAFPICRLFKRNAESYPTPEEYADRQRHDV